jgi:putative ABC transport system ATP-binding protein
MNKQTNDDHILSAQSVGKYYPETKMHALRSIDLTVHAGEFVGLRGPSGSGKSTLLNMFAALIKPTSGILFFKGRSYKKLGDANLFRRKNIGYIFQDFYLYPHFNVLENILLPCAYSLFSKRTKSEKAFTLLEYLGLEHTARQKVNTLSAGERQRVCIARALINEPEIILADEPTGSLDSANAKNILELLTTINKEKSITIIMATHDASVTHYTHRIIDIVDGTIINA